MKLDNLRDTQMGEILEWTEHVTTITPDSLHPTRIKDFPAAIEAAHRLKRVCKWKADTVADDLLRIEDAVTDAIEAEEYVFKIDRGGMPVLKKKYDTKAKRERELRLRLSNHHKYPELLTEKKKWSIMYSDWVTASDRLRREFRLLEVDYHSNGGEGTT